MRRTFIRAVRLIVALRCKAPGYAPLSKEAYRKERDRLIRIGRAEERVSAAPHASAAVRASAAAPAASTNDESVDNVVDEKELRRLRARISSAVDSEYKRMVKTKLSDGNGVGDDGGGGKGDGGKGGDGGGASAATIAQLEDDVQLLRDELASTQSKLQASIDGLGNQMRDVTALLRAALGEHDGNVRLEA